MSSTNEEVKLSYRDSSLPVEERVSDLLSRMTVAEKAGLLFQDMLIPGANGSLSDHNPVFGHASTEHLIRDKLMSHFNILGPIQNVQDTVSWYNALQKTALTQTRLGIPITVSTDPRHHFSDNLGTGFSAGVFSQWPETLGFAALRDEKLVETFAQIARQEYVACGIRLALHPQIDLSTEPRWSRVSKTFGEDAELSGKLARAYIRGFQGNTDLDKRQSVSCVSKHFPGGGPQKDGKDPHFETGKTQVYPGRRFDYHLKPFTEAIAQGTRWIMPYYGQPIGLTDIEEVGFAFNRGIITELLQQKLGFEGIICTDWGLISDANIMGQDLPARAWGCEHLSEAQRVAKVLEAGCDQLGGESRPELIIKLVEDGLLDEARINRSVCKLLTEKFELGLFEARFISLEHAENTVGKDDFKSLGEVTQRRSFTLLTNNSEMLPLRDLTDKKVYIEGIDKSVAVRHGLQTVDSVNQADLAILRLVCPFEAKPGGFESLFQDGSLEYPAKEKARQSLIFRTVPTIVDVYLDRAAAIPEIAPEAAALLVNYGANVHAFLDVITGVAKPEGRLPFDMPRSMEAVRASREDVPFDTVNPLFKFGDGLDYPQ